MTPPPTTIYDALPELIQLIQGQPSWGGNKYVRLARAEGFLEELLISIIGVAFEASSEDDAIEAFSEGAQAIRRATRRARRRRQVQR